MHTYTHTHRGMSYLQTSMFTASTHTNNLTNISTTATTIAAFSQLFTSLYDQERKWFEPNLFTEEQAAENVVFKRQRSLPLRGMKTRTLMMNYRG